MTTIDRRTDALIAARNAAQEALRRFDDAHVVTDSDDTSDALRDATEELICRIDALALSVEW